MKNENPVNEFDEFVNIVKKLRTECPWDRIQTHLSLRRCLLEETYETLEAIDENNMEELTLKEIIESETKKLIDRHPHVFGDLKVTDSEEVKKLWERNKKKEGRKSVMDGIPNELPALLKAYRIQEKASKVGFDWRKPGSTEIDEKPVFDKILEEINELKNNVDSGSPIRDIEDELGDVLFSIVNYSRYLKVNPEDALRRTINKFKFRFNKIEDHAKENSREMEEMTLEEMDVYWNEAKKK